MSKGGKRNGVSCRNGSDEGHLCKVGSKYRTNFAVPQIGMCEVGLQGPTIVTAGRGGEGKKTIGRDGQERFSALTCICSMHTPSGVDVRGCLGMIDAGSRSRRRSVFEIDQLCLSE